MIYHYSYGALRFFQDKWQYSHFGDSLNLNLQKSRRQAKNKYFRTDLTNIYQVTSTDTSYFPNTYRCSTSAFQASLKDKIQDKETEVMEIMSRSQLTFQKKY